MALHICEILILTNVIIEKYDLSSQRGPIWRFRSVELK